MKGLKVRRQLRTGSTKSPRQSPTLNSTALDRARTGQFPHTVLTMEDAADYIGGFRGERRADSCRQFLQDHDARLLQVGRSFRVRQSEVDRVLDTGKGSLAVQAEQAAAQLLRSAAGGSR